MRKQYVVIFKQANQVPWAVMTKLPPSVGHEMLQLEDPAAAVTAPSGTSPAPEQPEPTHAPAGSATSQPRAAHALASLEAHELPGCVTVGRGQWCV